jgi:hypothetical protein
MPPESFDNPGRTSTGDEKKGKGGIIALAIVLVLIFALVAVIALDIGGVRSQHIMGFVRNAPLIGALVPAAEEEYEEELTEEEMRLALHVYRDEILGLRALVAERDFELTTANARIDHLARFEANWQQYRVASGRFTQILAHNDAVNFVEFFQDIVNHDLVPQDILARVFAEAHAISVYDAELRMLVSTLNSMEAGRAAEDLERLLTANQPLAVRLLRAMGNSRRAEIFDEMEDTVSSRFIILLSTEPPTFTPLVPPPYLPEFIPPELPELPPIIDETEYEYYYDEYDYDEEPGVEPEPEPEAEPEPEEEPEEETETPEPEEE